MPQQPNDLITSIDSASLRELLSEVFRTRAARELLRAERGLNPETMMAARRTSLRALEDYADALDRLQWPIPRSIQQDLQLHRSLCERNHSYPVATRWM